MTLNKTGLFAALVLCGTALAQTAAPSPTTQTAPSSTQPASGQVAAPTASPADSQASNRIAAGSVIPVQLTKTIDAKKAKTGDQVEAKVTQDLKNGQGQVIVNKDTKVLGHVTEAQARNKEQKESQVGIAFDHAVMKGGGDIHLPMSIQAVIGPMNPNANGNGSNNENNQNAQASSAPAGGSSGAGPARAGGMGTGASSPNTDSATAPTASATNASGAGPGNANGPITGNTQGVIGISDLKLSAEPTAAQGSMLSSDKNNVKLESGTLLLLKVTQ